MTNLSLSSMDKALENICDENCWNKVWAFWIEGVAVPTTAVFGIVGNNLSVRWLSWIECDSIAGNILCLFVFNNKSVDLKPSFSNILKCLSVYDIAMLVSSYYNVDILNVKSVISFSSTFLEQL